MAHDDNKKRECRTAYVHNRLALSSIAITTGVSEPTLRRWKREAKQAGDDWDMMRARALISGEGFSVLIANTLEEFAVQFSSTMAVLRDDEGLSSAQRVRLMATLSDAFNKTVAAARHSAPKLSEIAVAWDILERLEQFVHRQAPDLEQALKEILAPFGEHLVEVYNAR